MRLALALVFLLNAEPALARCHSIWHYPWRQPNCGTVAPHRTWFVELKPEPPGDEALTRAQAIETLKQELRMRTTQALELQTLGLTEDKRNGD
jgi:hypothetical protein